MNKSKSVPIISQRLKEELARNKETQKHLCEVIGYDAPYFSRCLKKGRISGDALIAIAKHLDCSPEWLSKEDAFEGESNFGYQRGKLLRNKDSVFANLFLLCGYDPNDYLSLPEFMKTGLITEIAPIVQYYRNLAKGGVQYAEDQHALYTPGEWGIHLMDMKTGVFDRDENGEAYYLDDDVVNAILDVIRDGKKPNIENIIKEYQAAGRPTMKMIRKVRKENDDDKTNK